VNRRAKAYIRAGGGRLAIAPDRVVLLRPLGDRYVVEYDHAHVRAGEHAFTTHRAGHDHDLDLLMEFASTMPHLRFADFWHGYLKFLCAEVMLRSGRQRQHL
jgi:hypothetical protein